MCAKDLVKGKFLFMYADDIHGKEALAKVVKEEHAMLGMTSKTPELFGVLEQHPDGTLNQIVEKPEHPTSHLVNIGGFVVDDSIFFSDIAILQRNNTIINIAININTTNN